MNNFGTIYRCTINPLGGFRSIIMTNYAEQFRLFNLSTTPSDYKGANQFAQTFKRCSIQTNERVTYSADSMNLISNETANISTLKNTAAV